MLKPEVKNAALILGASKLFNFAKMKVWNTMEIYLTFDYNQNIRIDLDNLI